MQISVTGGLGFIGRHVVGALQEAGHTVTVIDTAVEQPAGSAESGAAPGSATPGATRVHSVDILDERRLPEAIEGSEVVFHLAGVSNVNHARSAPLDTVRTNIDGTANVCEAATRVGARVALASTVWVYGAAVARHEGRLDEDVSFDLTALDHVYTASKLAAEAVLQSYRRLYNLPTTVLRYGIPYGPGMREELVLARFVAQAQRGDPITIAGEGEQTRNYLYVGDLAAAHVAALDPAATGRVFALEGEQPISVREMAEVVLRLTGSRSDVRHVPARPGDYVARPVSNDLARNLLGWRPRTGFEDGVRRYLAWLAGTDRAPSAGSGSA